MSRSMGATIWIVDDDRSIRWVLEKALSKSGFACLTFRSADVLLGAASLPGPRPPDAIISDIRMPGVDGLELLATLKARFPEIPVIIMTAYSDLESTVAAYREGAFEYLPKPFDLDEAVAVVERAVGAGQGEGLAPGTSNLAIQGKIIGSAPAMQDVFRAIGRLARSTITVLVTGESGTGKELVARALHEHGPRAGGPFIALNTAAIPRDLLESELFGHERGAFTGAQFRREGRFEQADRGTLFLDEIGDMPAELQTRLLRVLADGEFYRVGGHATVRADVRIVAATHQDLERAVAAGRFREDLFHRLNVIRVKVPALRERREDIPLLATHFLEHAARELDVQAKVLRRDAEQRLMALDWPGNVRQLENACRWLTVMAPAREIHYDDLPYELRATGEMPSSDGHWEKELEGWARAMLSSGRRSILSDALPLFEKTLIEVALRHTAGRRQEAAVLLGWGRNTLTRKIREHGLDDELPGPDPEPGAEVAGDPGGPTATGESEGG